MSPRHIGIKVSAMAGAAVLGLTTWWLPIGPASGNPPPPPVFSQFDVAASAAHPSIGLGTSSAMSGTTLVVGGHNAQGRMTAYVFKKPTAGWSDLTPIAVLTTTGPVNDVDDLPSVAISGTAVVVGVDSATVGRRQRAGEVEIFTQPSGGWANTSRPTEMLTPHNPSADAQFGQDVAVDGNTIAVGSSPENNPSGAAYVFTRPAGTPWTHAAEQGELTASTAGANAHLMTVAVSGPTVVLTGRTPDVYVFTEPSTGWVSGHETGELETDASDTSDGTSVAIDAGTIAFGVPSATVTVQNQGAAYVFVPPTHAGWVASAFPQGATAVLTAPDPHFGDSLGQSVAISDGRIIVGADGRTVDGMGARGAVFVWDSHGGGWDGTPTPYELTTTTGHVSDSFGASVTATPTFIAAGAPEAENPAATNPTPGDGVEYVFAPPAPALQSVTQGPASWRAGKRPARANPPTTPHGGTTYSFSLSEAAAVTLEFAKQLPGRKAHGRCVAVNKANRHHAHCARYARRIGLPPFSLPAGHNTIWFDGWLGTDGLMPGRFRVILTARADGTTSSLRTLHFRIRKP